MKSLELQDLHATNRNGENTSDKFLAMDQEQNINEIWLDNNDEDDDRLDLNEASMFYSEFPTLPDFPCMSSSSSSSSTPLPLKPIASSSSSVSSSAASWALLKCDAEEDIENKNKMTNYHNYHDQIQCSQLYHDPMDANPAALSSTASMEISQPFDQGLENCMDVMDTLEYMDFFDPCSLFENGQNPLQDFEQQDVQQIGEDRDTPPLVFQQKQLEQMMSTHQSNNIDSNKEEESKSELDDMSMVFFEWLKSNRECVSADDLRNVKFRKETIECAAKRLGGGKQGMKHLLKLVLEWVQTNHLKKRPKEAPISSTVPFPNQFQDPNPNSINQETNPACFTTQPYMTQQPPTAYDPTSNLVVAPPPQTAYPSPIGYMGDPNSSFANGSTQPYVSQSPMEYQMLDTTQTWASPQFNAMAPQTTFGSNYGTNQYPYSQCYQGGQGEQLMSLGSSATKEARKKRMARQRRHMSHYRQHHHQRNHIQNQQSLYHHQNQSVDPHGRLVNKSDNCTQLSPGNWVYWPSVAGGVPSASPVIQGIPADSLPTMDRPPSQLAQGRVASDRRQGWKAEKNLRFLLQKVLKQSDVGNLGRIVLPKKEAETHLPELEARDGINIAMEDIGTSRVWNLRYRYWPNNKSRMYLLENTGDFVKANGLQEGDFIVIYSDTKCGKYMIRGVKVRQGGPKSENKRAGKSHRGQQITVPAGSNGSSPSSPTITQRNLY